MNFVAMLSAREGNYGSEREVVAISESTREQSWAVADGSCETKWRTREKNSVFLCKRTLSQLAITNAAY